MPPTGNYCTHPGCSRQGYTLETLTATDISGKGLALTKVSDGEYTLLNFSVDIPADAYYYDAALWAAENGITKVTNNTTFSPGASCTRAQIVTFLYRYFMK